MAVVQALYPNLKVLMTATDLLGTFLASTVIRLYEHEISYTSVLIPAAFQFYVTNLMFYPVAESVTSVSEKPAAVAALPNVHPSFLAHPSKPENIEETYPTKPGPEDFPWI